MRRWRGPWKWLTTAVVLGSVAWPLTWPLARDSFPLSNYPMFAKPMLTPSCTLAQAYAVDASGRRDELTPTVIGRPTWLEANTQLELLLDRDAGRIQSYCANLAKRVAAVATFGEARRIELVRNEYDALAYHAGAKQPKSTVVYATCGVR